MKVMDMSISEREQQALDFIEEDLAGSGAALAAKLAVFTRRTAGETMPRRESVRCSVGPPRGGPVRAGVTPGTARISRCLGKHTVRRLLALALTLAHPRRAGRAQTRPPGGDGNLA